ncbi:MAG: signaling protein [Bacteroidetes bacterium]|nr:MAG: signaling protein [Bacteroidota bacterium]
MAFSCFFAKSIKAMSTKTLLLALCCGLGWTAHAQTGLLGEYYTGQNFERKVLTRTDPQINFFWMDEPPAPELDPHVYSIRWTGFIETPESGTYLFRAYVDDGIRVYVNGQRIIDAWDLHDTGRFMGEIYLKAGKRYSLKVEYFNAMFEGEIKLHWQLPSEAPYFKGALGYNDHPIASRYLAPPESRPEPLQPVATPPKPQPPAPKHTTPPPPQPEPAPPPKKEPAPAPIAADTLEKYIPKNILFVKSKPIMLPESRPELDRLAGFLLRNPQYTLFVAGHTDRIGNSEKNMILSRERASTVAAYLTEKGIAASRITAVGYGDTRPLYVEPEGVANAKNRRVEFEVRE